MITTEANQALADKYRADAKRQSERAVESFERSDTDGFLTQWASNLSSQESTAKAEIAESNGRADFPALFDLDGNLVAAKLVDTRFGSAWGLLDSDDPTSAFVGWFSPSYARNPETRRANNAKKGYQVGRVLAPAAATIGGGGTGLSGAMSARVVIFRTDKGFSRDVEIIDNGS